MSSLSVAAGRGVGCLFVWVLYARTKQNKVSRLRAKRSVQVFTIALSPTPLPHAGEGLTHISGFGFDFSFDLKSPAAAPSIADEAGVFGEDCLSEASSAAARFGEKRRE